MSILVQQLPQRLYSMIVYDSVQVENLVYDPVSRSYTARVYGICGGNVVPLNIVTAVKMHRIEEVVISDEEIDTVLTEHPEYGSDRIAAAMVRAFQRLFALAAETKDKPYA